MADIVQLVEAKADPAIFNEYLTQRRRALLAQAKALNEQRAAVLSEVRFIEQHTGIKFERKPE